MTAGEELRRWNERFAAAGYLFGTAPNAFLAAHKGLLRRVSARSASPTARAATASGWQSRRWKSQRSISPVAVQKARRLGAEHGVQVRYEVAGVYDWRWPEAEFDLVAAIFVQFADPPMRAFLFERMVRALKPGALLLLEGYTPRQLEYRTGGPPHRENLYTEPMLREAFAGLEMLELREYDADVAEGSGHSGRSALIDLVARKPA